LQPLDIVTLHT